MDEPKSLDSLFKDKIFRIPDYQRGFAWKQDQLKNFWEDLVNLTGNRAHYTGVLTLKQTPDSEVDRISKEFWLVDDHSFHVFHVVDGQQRLTTFIIFLKALVEFYIDLPENKGKAADKIYITENMSVTDLESRYLFRTKPTGDKFRTYLFGYEIDNPSNKYLLHRILGEPGSGSIEETYYTLNLNNAKAYFLGQFHKLYEEEGSEGLQNIFKKLTRRFLFNEYIIEDEFDVFVAFETMNNRGKKLSDLELLKNRLIYLTTLYDDNELDQASRKNLREMVNEAWKEVYHQLGRNKLRPLNDDDFLRSHWIMYYKYSRKTGQDYIKFLLDEQFPPKKIYKKIEREVPLEVSEEMRTEQDDEDDIDVENGEAFEDTEIKSVSQLSPTEIRDYANSIKDSSVHWFNSFFPDLTTGISAEERLWINRLNRIGIGYFRPLVMAILKNVKDEPNRVLAYRKIERFIFINFRMNSAPSNSGSSEFYNTARALDRGEMDINKLVSQLEKKIAYTFHSDKTFRINDFYNNLFKKFKKGSGYYGWSGLRFFLYEYETSLLSESRQKKVGWNDILKSEKDKISIEHVYPQTETDSWSSIFTGIKKEQRKYYGSSLGNLLLLSMSINASLQNDSFNDKKRAKLDTLGNKVRNGYADGSHSEIEVAQYDVWGPEQIKNRGIKLLGFLEKRWDIHLRDEDREKLLFLDSEEVND